MLRPVTIFPIKKLSRRLLQNICLLLMLWVLLPAGVLAQSPEPPAGDSQQCARCHADETTAWEASPHARVAAGAVTCEACHGAYVKGHPEAGLMHLGVDSASCQKCHAETYKQWQGSSHGQANIQCISCHLSHSQEFRLTDEALCRTCHRQQLNDFAHISHAGADLTCTDCHLSTGSHPPNDGASLAEVSGSSSTPNHSFVVTPQTCISCHERAPVKAVFHTIEPQNKGNGQLLELTSRLKAVRQTNLRLKGWSLAGLGLGLGLGGILGIIFMLVMGSLTRSRKL